MRLGPVASPPPASFGAAVSPGSGAPVVPPAETPGLEGAASSAFEGILSHVLPDAEQLREVLAHVESRGDPQLLAESRETVVEHLSRSGKIVEAIDWL